MDDDALLHLVGQLGVALKARSLTLALAESCTGGMVSQFVTAIAGSSAWFDRGFVTYSNTAKQEMLDVKELTLTQYGAVSEQTAHEMALGALQHSKAKIAASITGIAGPSGGTESKPVGTVCFGFALKIKQVNNQTSNQTNMQFITQTMHFSGNRDAVRRQSVTHALETLITLTLSLDL
ncbi:MAG: nicotinamide-nucleotide amidohydrolase family protein [Methylotenera sp.]